MKAVLNRQTFLLLTGVLQPVSATGMRDYLRAGLEDDLIVPDEDVIYGFLMDEAKKRRMIRVCRDPDLFSLSRLGNENLTRRHRLTRDKLRLFLLKESRSSRVQASRETDATGSDGASSSLDERPLVKGTAANGIGRSVPPGRYHWPLFSRQLPNETGPLDVSRDASGLPFLSFENSTQVAVASGKVPGSFKLDFSTIGLLMGVSPRLISQIAKRPDRHYRKFELTKRSGGVRVIESPRTFLKTIQFFLDDFFLSGLPVHESVFSYRPGLGIIDNASIHSNCRYVGNIDIENFFGSVSSELVERLLLSHEYGPQAAKIISRLTTKDRILPQGAPTSPSISNSLLFSFDRALHAYCDNRGLGFTRYADDITISGGSREKILEGIDFAGRVLQQEYGLKLNKEKTRVSSARSQQRVTGLVVNHGVRPPRVWRRRVRAAFHRAKCEGTVDVSTYNQLAGYVSYLQGFEMLRENQEIRQYRKILRALQKKS